MSEHLNDPSPSEKPSFVVCLHCGRQWDTGTRVCPQCGSIALTGLAWPPTPTGQEEPYSPPKDIGTVQSGLALGCSVYVFTWLIFAGLSVGLWVQEYGGSMTKLHHKAIVIALLIGWCGLMTIIYFLIQSRQPRTARGYGYILLVAIALNLGMGIICARS